MYSRLGNPAFFYTLYFQYRMNVMKIFKPLLFTSFFFTLLSCYNEVDINAEYKPMGVIFGILDPAADTQFVRVTRGYLSKENVLASTNISDSIYYKNLNVSLYELSNVNDTLRKTTLIADATARTLKEGLFTTDGYAIYRTDGNFKLKPGFNYCLLVKSTNQNVPVMKASTETIFANTENGFIDFLEPAIKPAQVPPNLTFYREKVRWSPNSGFSSKVELTQYYLEIDTTTKQEKMENFTITIPYSTGEYKFIRFGEFQEAIKQQISVNTNVVRFLDETKLRVTIISNNLDAYIRFLQKQEEFQLTTNFTNVENGVGILASRTTVVKDLIFLEKASQAIITKKNELCKFNFANVTGDGDTVVCEVGPDGVGRNKLISFK